MPFQATVKPLSVERPVDGGAADAARAIIAKVATGHLKQKFGSRDIIRAQWSMLRDRDTVHAALDVLVDHDWLDVQHIKTGGRTRTVYEINPKVELPNKGKGVPDKTDRSSGTSSFVSYVRQGGASYLNETGEGD